MKAKILILLIAAALLLSACGVKDWQNCPDGGMYSFSPVDNCVVGVVW